SGRSRHRSWLSLQSSRVEGCESPARRETTHGPLHMLALPPGDASVACARAPFGRRFGCTCSRSPSGKRSGCTCSRSPSGKRCGRELGLSSPDRAPFTAVARPILACSLSCQERAAGAAAIFFAPYVTDDASDEGMLTTNAAPRASCVIGLI